jgi:transposase
LVRVRRPADEDAMSLRPASVGPVPEETARVARAAFPRGNIFLRMRDALGALFTDDSFASLFPTRGQPALSPWRLALITIMSYAEGCPTARPPMPSGGGSLGSMH